MPDTGTRQTPQQARQNLLQKIDHIVVLMLENRSFDHVLGYLTKEHGRNDIDGIRDGHPMVPMTEQLETKTDPGHGWDDVEQQLAKDPKDVLLNPDSFRENFRRRLKAGEKSKVDYVCGYYNASQVWAYHHLAKHFAVADRWFCSVPSDTFANRLYSLCGTTQGEKSGQRIPIYVDDRPTFVRHLDTPHNRKWRWYIHDACTLQLIDDHFRRWDPQHIRSFKHFKSDVAPRPIDSTDKEQLPEGVIWIDPNFGSIGLPKNANDDHPPAPIGRGQMLVADVFNTLASNPRVWNKTLLIITYDEHGGFYDHVPPSVAGTAASPDDRSGKAFEHYGIRVPALIVSPWIPAGTVMHEVVDHTVIMNTVLQRFHPNPEDAIRAMGRRCESMSGRHLGWLLTEETPRPAVPIQVPAVVYLRAALSETASRTITSAAAPLDSPMEAASVERTAARHHAVAEALGGIESTEEEPSEFQQDLHQAWAQVQQQVAQAESRSRNAPPASDE